MKVGEICSRIVILLRGGDSVLAAAKLMREHHVGSLVVTGRGNGKNVPIGIITDRDIAVGVVALGLDPVATPVGDVIAPEVVCIDEEASTDQAIALMRQKGLRRLPVVDAEGDLVGLIAADDLLEFVAEEVADLSGMIASERRRERQTRAAPESESAS